MELTIGEVARRTGMTERTLRYYEELGLVDPGRDDGGRRRYDGATLARLYRVRLLRELGTPVGNVDPGADLATLARRHLADLDTRLAELARQRERVRAVEDRLLGGAPPTDEALLDLLAGLAGEEPGLTRRITLLVYRDLAAAHAWLVEVFGLAPGPLSYDGDRAHHGELYVGDGVLWLHEESEAARMVSPLGTGGRVTASLAVHVADADAHHAHAASAGAEIAYPPINQPYGYREYSARDLEGHFWSFQQPLEEDT
jgi:DNA-binding transcriptional MerR regulator/uncharacterized glyoxalase superfamily protein PhnB